jgi:hypothetical protein
VKVSVTLDGHTKNVADEVRVVAVWDVGTVPKALREIEDEIDRVAETQQFLAPKTQ